LNLIILILTFILKTQPIWFPIDLNFTNFKWFWSLFFIFYVQSTLMPLYTCLLFCSFRKDKRLHSSTVKWLCFEKIRNFKLISVTFDHIFYFKIVPLQMTSCIWVNSHEKIVLKFCNLYKSKIYFENNIKISWLKEWVKMKMIGSLCVPILPNKLSVCEFESFIFVQMSVWEKKRFLIPCRVSGLISGS